MANSKSMQQRRDELMESLRKLLERMLIEHGHSSTAALVMASDCTDQYAQMVAGQTICYPKDHRFKLQSRENEIYSQFNGRNVPELAMQYDMTERGMYKLIARVRKRMREGA